MNKLDKDYQALLQDILDNGVTKKDRTGTGTISVFGRQIRHRMSDGFPLLTSKKMYFKGIVTELLWFLRGDTNIKYLVDNNCHIWDGDALKAYHKHELEEINKFIKENPFTLVDFQYTTMEEFINKIKTDDEFAKKFGNLGPIYGKQWRSWNNGIVNSLGDVFEREVKYDIENSRQPYSSSMRKYVTDEIKKLNPPIDQIANLINDLKTNPDSRRLMVSAWNVGELDQMVLPPCHYGFEVYTRELKKLERINIAIEKKLTHETAHLTKDFDYQKWCDEQNIPTRAISLMWNQRSCDFPLGIPANIMSYGILLMMLAKQVNMIPDELIGNFGDCHIYLNQIDGVKEQLTREPYPLPIVKLSDRVVNDISEYTHNDIILENYQSHPKIYFPLSN
jgi:thymidylate synthase